MSPGVSFISYSHSIDDIDDTLHTLDEVCGFLNSNVLHENYDTYLEGNLPKKVWTMKIPPTKKLNKWFTVILIINIFPLHNRYLLFQGTENEYHWKYW